MVVGGEVVNLKNLEESTGLMIDEMPLDVSPFSTLLLLSLPFFCQFALKK